MFFYKINGQRKFDKFGRGKILIYQLNPNLTISGPLHDGLQTGATPLFVTGSRNRKKWKVWGVCREFPLDPAPERKVLETILMLIWD